VVLSHATSRRTCADSGVQKSQEKETTIESIPQMLSRSIVRAPKSALSLQQALELTNLYLENVYRTTDNDMALVLCHDEEVALS